MLSCRTWRFRSHSEILLRKMFLFVKILAVMTLYQVKGDNIMFGKPSKQSSTIGPYESSRANDGLDSTFSATGFTDQQLYWQGDLQGYYTISNITVRVPFVFTSNMIFVGASVLDVTYPGSDVITCGEWQETSISNRWHTFTCNFSQPVRYIIIWREFQHDLYIEDVDVQGIVGKLSEINFELTESKKVSTPTASFNVSTRAECAAACFNTQPCISFSFRQGGQLNCLLATDANLTSDTDWVTYNC